MPLVEPVIRPPSEADSFLLQITTGCSSNSCTFCGAYLNKPFSVKTEKEIKEDIEQWSRSFPDTRRVFLLDADALVVSNKKLLPVLTALAEKFPLLSRVSSYANAANIIFRNAGELRELAEHKLRLIYIGLESGCQELLTFCRKQSGVSDMVDSVKRSFRAGIKSSVIVLLGLGGREWTSRHVAGTITALNQMQPRYLSFLSLMLVPGTELYNAARQGRFNALNARELLQQAHDIIAGLELKGTIFRSDHASNYLSLEGRFPQDKGLFLSELSKAIEGVRPLRPECFRGL